jgi:hypothetical protein
MDVILIGHKSECFSQIFGHIANFNPRNSVLSERCSKKFAENSGKKPNESNKNYLENERINL